MYYNLPQELFEPVHISFEEILPKLVILEYINPDNCAECGKKLHEKYRSGCCHYSFCDSYSRIPSCAQLTKKPAIEHWMRCIYCILDTGQMPFIPYRDFDEREFMYDMFEIFKKFITDGQTRYHKYPYRNPNELDPADYRCGNLPESNAYYYEQYIEMYNEAFDIGRQLRKKN